MLIDAKTKDVIWAYEVHKNSHGSLLFGSFGARGHPAQIPNTLTAANVSVMLNSQFFFPNLFNPLAHVPFFIQVSLGNLLFAEIDLATDFYPGRACAFLEIHSGG